MPKRNKIAILFGFSFGQLYELTAIGWLTP